MHWPNGVSANIAPEANVVGGLWAQQRPPAKVEGPLTHEPHWRWKSRPHCRNRHLHASKCAAIADEGAAEGAATISGEGQSYRAAVHLLRLLLGV